ncbi:acyl-CoA Delta-9 desaturase-like [Diorhabda carinulata]|uniref:acyl-CoA Delta-9 desaturase-like n=1 Tax=Diorhabda carinulata TaxID=1163345 RepID=UPI0025A2A0BA|nr:acyl-CoA Delta-9 desaturase-like [Diorhabda carinulata]XP_057658393.1 acyl-CoA Delta-9 desaturase-like [Diorhabda carinulata]XP_057658394.1 acyl-CoA Delta-9 desaturase-like [Diorhabda carinulata]
MAPNLLGSTSSFMMAEPTCAEPVQIISTKDNIHQNHQTHQQPTRQSTKRKQPKYKWDIVWRNVMAFLLLHTVGVYGFYCLLLGRVMCKTIMFNILLAVFAGLGVTAGAHRLWAHRTYKAKLPFRVLLVFFQTIALQNDIYEWVRDHRVHHKFTDTDADPHNASRGFFFSHIGWLMVRKHKDVIEKGKTVYMSDVEADPVIRFQRKYYVLLVTLLTFLLPAHIPWYFWGENYFLAWYTCIFRYTLSLNFTWLVNSAAHIWGTKPYDKSINPTENKYVAILGFGEGWHNYHHTFPWDYKAAELGDYKMNYTTAVLDFMAYIGLVYDRKTASVEMVKKRVDRTGDGSWTNGKAEEESRAEDGHHHSYEDCVWGWGDKDMKEEEIRDVIEFNNLKED